MNNKEGLNISPTDGSKLFLGIPVIEWNSNTAIPIKRLQQDIF